MRVLMILVISAAIATARNWRNNCKDSCIILSKYLEQQDVLAKNDVKTITRLFCSKNLLSDDMCNQLVLSSKVIKDYMNAGVSIRRICRWKIVCPIKKYNSRKSAMKIQINRAVFERTKTEDGKSSGSIKTTSSLKTAGKKRSPKINRFVWKRMKSNFLSFLESLSPLKQVANNFLTKAERYVQKKKLLQEKTTNHSTEEVQCITCHKVRAHFSRKFTETEKIEARQIFAAFCNEIMPPFIQNMFCDEQSLDKLVRVIQLTARNTPGLCEKMQECKNIQKPQFEKTILRRKLCDVCSNLEAMKDKMHYLNLDAAFGKMGEQCDAAFQKCPSSSIISSIVKYSYPSWLNSFTKDKCEKMLKCYSIKHTKQFFTRDLYCNMCRKLESSMRKVSNSLKLQQLTEKCKAMPESMKLQCLRHVNISIDARLPYTKYGVCERILCNSNSPLLRNLASLQQRTPTENLCQFCQAGLNIFSSRDFSVNFRNTINNVCKQVGVQNKQCLNEKFRVDKFFQSFYKNTTIKNVCTQMSFCGADDNVFMNNIFRRVKGILSSFIAGK